MRWWASRTCAGEPAPVLTTEDNGTLGELLLRGLVPERLPLAEAAALGETPPARRSFLRRDRAAELYERVSTGT